MGLGWTARRSIKKECIICGDAFKVKNSCINVTVCCGRKCANILHSIRMTADGNSNWRGGIGNLPWAYEFNDILKSRIRLRDGNKCRLCWKDIKIAEERHGCGLAVHHIDYNKLNNSDSNLISLCNECHGKTHYNRKLWTKRLLKILSE